ncbi:hypothetical protein [Endozoicomonas numazuensis]|uniref:Uncharacterized protein n=1 Tax=Endozoicomonas numazuensis TaxID=1137799 RepID=A0A081NHQ6_9GAMM|nr:hypothetical protein [Endozoicomonas numazuensis]KEQ17979.1 hypothetical protein GZ78_10225 [Endozoicomonas numazuensis]
MSDKRVLNRYYQVILFTVVMLAIFLSLKGFTVHSVSVVIYVLLCCVLCIAIAHLRSTGVLNYRERWLYYCVIGIPIFYYFFIIIFRASFYEMYLKYISSFRFAEEVVNTIIPAMAKTENDLISMELYRRIEEVRHNFVFVGLWTFLSSYMICSHSISLSTNQKKDIAQGKYSKAVIDHKMKFVIVIFSLGLLYGFNFSLVSSESCSIRCGGVEDSDSSFLTLYNLGSFFSFIVCTFLFKMHMLSEYSELLEKSE